MTYKTASHLSILLRSCATHSLISQAKQINVQILLSNYLDNVTLQTDLLLAYSKSGFLQEARKVFDRMPERNMHSWNIMMSSYAQNYCYSDAICIFDNFLKLGFRPDHYTLPPLFKAVAGVGDCYLGFVLHGWVIRLGYEGYVVVGSSVLDFYLKGGELVEAKRLFSNMLWRDCGVWNLMISGFGRAGFYVEALSLVRNMVEEGVKLDALVVPSILSACGGEGDLMKGKEIHGRVVKSALFIFDVVISNSLIDMYARCGCLNDSEKRMKLEATASVWGALLGGCVMHKNVNIGEIAAHCLFELEPGNLGNYIALCYIYQSHGISDGIAITRAKMRELGLAKSPGCSWITIAGTVHKFYQGCHSHPLTKVTCEILDRMIKVLILPGEPFYNIL
ncbi:hypothetical protein OIU77_018746 [Salix suchowensis]|uniref:Pentatricopeptide repeat-containing protein n=1 Tax=Salix suchowensis TaxID=1278906 RepID=A0ABQ9CHQ3_9ROSI|nr:hypothetical protein OIU77_018746 [Salix suchowensis]